MATIIISDPKEVQLQILDIGEETRVELDIAHSAGSDHVTFRLSYTQLGKVAETFAKRFAEIIAPDPPGYAPRDELDQYERDLRATKG